MSPLSHAAGRLMPPLSPPAASLAILCGGQSRRLGTDKGLYRPLGDEPLVARALRLLGAGFAEVLLVTRDEEQAALYRQALASHPVPEIGGTPIRVVHDGLATGGQYRPETAALVGVHTALDLATREEVVLLPVDQVGVRSHHLTRLLAAAKDDPTRGVAYRGPEARCLPFPSLWRRADREKVATLIAAQTLSVAGALADLAAAAVDGGDLTQDLSHNGNTAEELAAYFGAPLFDPFGRRLHYLRFSLTEACNLSCSYCLPDGFPEWYRHKARLGLAEIDVLLRGFRQLGFRKVRLTGGEPTVHPRCLETVRLARKLGYETIAMTTNGLLMPDLDPWIEAGLTQLNVSLDSLDPETFQAVTGSREAVKVRRLIETAASRGLVVKVNTVLLRSRNGQQANIEALIDWALDQPITLRFIELMETKLNGAFAAPERILGREIEPFLEARGLRRIGPGAAGSPRLQGPATDYTSPVRLGRIGLINPMSCNFCSDCNRLRVTAKGRLKLCLFGDQDLPLDLTSAEAVALNVRRLIGRKPERHYLEEGNVGNVATFRTIGG